MVIRRFIVGCALATALVDAAIPLGHEVAAASVIAFAMDGTDTIIFKDGRTLTGTIVSETATTVRFKGLAAGGISYETEYNRSDILEIKKGAKVDAPEAAKPQEPARNPATKIATPAQTDVPSPGREDAKDAGPKVYVIPLEGEFGVDISESPLRRALKDAKAENPDYIVLVLNNKWNDELGTRLPDDTAAFDELFRAEKIMPIVVEEMPKEWKKMPEIIVWVKQGMGGAAFLPMISKNIYMTSDGRMGGVGNLTRLFGSTGDEIVRQKQYSLRLAHAEGWANVGGYDYRLVRAMAVIEYVLSVRYDPDPTLVEAMPDPLKGEVLLTDDGVETREDTTQSRARGEGNDVLTLSAKLAQDLKVSKATVDTMDDLLNELRLPSSTIVIEKKPASIMTGWSNEVDRAKVSIRKLWQEFGEIQIDGDFVQRNRARGQQEQKLKEIKGLLKRYGEALTARWRGQSGIPTEVDIDNFLEQIQIQRMQDRK